MGHVLHADLVGLEASVTMVSLFSIQTLLNIIIYGVHIKDTSFLDIHFRKLCIPYIGMK